jgi:diguanylate cyclase
MAVIAAGHVEQLRAQADRDSLTGMLNRRAFMRELSTEIERSVRYGHPFVLALCDLDEFKKINDTDGHPAGDRALEAVAALLERTIRASDVAFRIGGDEFALVFECAGEADAERIGWELRSHAPERIGSTLSVGLALAEDGETDEAMVARADAALYEVKRRGRNGVIVAPPGIRPAA